MDAGGAMKARTHLHARDLLEQHGDFGRIIALDRETHNRRDRFVTAPMRGARPYGVGRGADHPYAGDLSQPRGGSGGQVAAPLSNRIDRVHCEPVGSGQESGECGQVGCAGLHAVGETIGHGETVARRAGASLHERREIDAGPSPEDARTGRPEQPLV